MPVHCPLNIEPLSTERFRSLDYAVMGHIHASQNILGRLADEQVYRSHVAQRLNADGMYSREEVPITLTHQAFAKTLYLDLVVSGKGIYELKTVTALQSNHVAQLLTYLYLLDQPRGKLVNFRSPTVQSKFVNAPIPRAERCKFSVSEEAFRGDRHFILLVVDLVRDWGTSLSVSLYHQAIVCLLGGQEAVERMLPLTRDGQHFSKQRFQLVDFHSSFELTAFAKPDWKHADHLQRLLNFSPLRCLHWVNIGPHCITFQTIEHT
jgi:GxxExxY protein